MDQMIQVSAGILIRDNKVLLAKRPAGKHLAGYWEFPGGKVEPGESPEESLAREFKEEFGVEVLVNGLFHINIHSYPGKKVRLISFLVMHKRGDFMLHEHEEIAWAELKELLNFPLSPADIPVAEKLVANPGAVIKGT